MDSASHFSILIILFGAPIGTAGCNPLMEKELPMLGWCPGRRPCPAYYLFDSHAGEQPLSVTGVCGTFNK